ncbi:enoyl-CoA hydratase/carnithine racemase [Desulfosalsimonas propionicica]|uniref:Enoyl-CoA hydratase domain-containing protein 3, mitochondrial n=1 Tax=Desulfosalsimonas propionicica TaxID=332175 RepID=A0A7W0CA89_9BACT|nr:enoyl-CoA hydratase-related protein [Desulfosalsimonas propionicica]MBA2881980.1 enoyl-CoA hydratase/carnithine racemase [Desulfosalsimonas propionicica]
MAYETIKTEVNENIGFITFNRPDHLNTFNSTLAREFSQALEVFENDTEVRVIVVTGQGKAFCAGIDVNELSGKQNLDYYRWVKQMEEMSLRIADMGTPVIASVQDLAVANGIGVVASADLAVAAEGARFGATAVNVGLFCMGPAVALSRNLGRKKALELVITGEMITGEEAWRIGLVNKVVPKDQLEEETLSLARKIAGKSPLAVQLGKRSFYQMEDLEYSRAYEMANNHFAMLCSTEDAHEGVDAFLNKRKPDWKLR